MKWKKFSLTEKFFALWGCPQMCEMLTRDLRAELIKLTNYSIFGQCSPFYLWKTPENHRTFGVFREYKIGNLAGQKWVKILNLRNQQVLSYNAFTAWKVSKDGVFIGLYFPSFGLNTKKYEPLKNPYLDTFHTMFGFPQVID